MSGLAVFLIAFPCFVVYFWAGMLVNRRIFRRCRLAGIKHHRQQYPSLCPTDVKAAKEWMSLDGAFLLTGLVVTLPVWPVIWLLGGTVSFIRGAVTSGERDEVIQELERELSMDRRPG